MSTEDTTNSSTSISNDAPSASGDNSQRGSIISPSHGSNQNQSSEEQSTTSTSGTAADFPSHLVCPITGEPPFRAVTFDTPNAMNQNHPQVFEHSAMHRNITIMFREDWDRRYGNGRCVLHPLTREPVDRENALALLSNVSPEVQEDINRERTRLRLSITEETSPLEHMDFVRYARMLRKVALARLRYAPVCFCIGPCNCDPSVFLRQEVEVVEEAQVPPPDNSSDEEPAPARGGGGDDDGLEIPHELDFEEIDRSVSRRLNYTSTAGTSAASGTRGGQAAASSAGTSGQAPNASGNRGGRAASSTGPNRRLQMGGFVNVEGNALRSPDHTTALVNLLQLGSSHPDGLGGTLGQNNRTSWVRDNLQAFFAPGGPLSRFQPITHSVLMRHIRGAQDLARTYFNRDHSNDTTGAEGESVPQWARLFFVLFEVQQNQEARTNQQAAVREQRAGDVRSLVGAQAPLGRHNNNQAAQLRNETSRNAGTAAQRRQIIGDITVERVSLREGRDDTANRQPAPRRNVQNGARRRNVHLNSSFSPGINDPSSRFSHLQEGYQSLNALTSAVTHLVAAPPAPPPAPPRTIINVTRDYHEIAQLIDTGSDDPNQAFYREALSQLAIELRSMRSGGGGASATNDGDSSGSNTDSTSRNEGISGAN